MKQELSDVIIEGNEERYQFTWPGKKEARLLANTPIKATLRPCVEESVDFDTTQNLYIEGDNLEVLKLLRETYLGKIKMIYIDPPYNTGNDSFVYDDDSSISEDEFEERSGARDEEGNLLYNFKTNNESNGRFHTDWLNMMYPRLALAKDLLSDDGVIFISIDDRELDNLLKMVKDLFNERNLINIITVKTNETKGLKNSHVDKSFPKNKEYLVAVAKDCTKYSLKEQKVSKSVDELREYVKYYNKYIKNIDDDCSEWVIEDFNNLTKGKSKDEIFKLKDQYKDRMIYFVAPDSFDDDKIPLEKDRFYKITNKKGKTNYYYRDEKGKILNTLFLIDNYYKNLGDLWTDISTININKEICGMPTYANGQKPLKLLERIIDYVVQGDKNEIVLDFFAGSCTTAHAVMNLNMRDNGNRKFIMVQIREKLEESNEYTRFLDSIGKPNFLTEIGKERIRRAGKKIKEDSPLTTGDLDIGFRVYKVDTSNMKDVYYKPDQTSQQSIEDMFSNVKEDRTPMDLLFQVMLETDVLLSSKIEEKVIEGKKVFIVNDNDLICCFDSGIGDDVIKAIAQMKPLYAVFRDSSFSSDSTMVNAEQYFRTYSKDTELRII